MKTQLDENEKHFQEQMEASDYHFQQQVEHNNKIRIENNNNEIERINRVKSYEFKINDLREKKNMIYDAIHTIREYEQEIYNSPMAEQLADYSENGNKDAYRKFKASSKAYTSLVTSIRVPYSFVYNNFTNEKRKELDKLGDKLNQEAINISLFIPQHIRNDTHEEERLLLATANIIETDFRVSKLVESIVLIMFTRHKEIEKEMKKIHEEFEDSLGESSYS